jgi:hypothetical protein
MTELLNIPGATKNSESYFIKQMRIKNKFFKRMWELEWVKDLSKFFILFFWGWGF